MLYLGQVCKYKDEAGIVRPAIFLGFKTSLVNTVYTRNAHLLFVDTDGCLKDAPVNVTSIGYIKQHDPKSPTGKSIYMGTFCVGIVNEHILLKRPHNAAELLQEASKILLTN